MRAASTETLAEKGVHRVAASFEDLRWGPVINRPHDLGTDIFVQVWPRGFDIGIVIGVQVKTGDSYFAKPDGDPDAPVGWWYSESSKNHFNYWSGHALPHLLILHEHRTQVSYWVHVTSEAVHDTGQGAKILVPSTSTLDVEHVDELLAVAGTGRSSVAFEGSTWTGGADTPSTDQLRFALIAPRLIATRRRDWFQETPSPEQVVGLIARAEFDRIDRLRDPGDQFLGTKEPEIPSSIKRQNPTTGDGDSRLLLKRESCATTSIRCGLASRLPTRPIDGGGHRCPRCCTNRERRLCGSDHDP